MTATQAITPNSNVSFEKKGLTIRGVFINMEYSENGEPKYANIQVYKMNGDLSNRTVKCYDVNSLILN